MPNRKLIACHGYAIVAITIVAFTVSPCQSCHRPRGSFCPNEYVGKFWVPNWVKIPPRDHQSWKDGLPDGNSIAEPLIDETFIIWHEGMSRFGYVPLNPLTGEVLDNSGVTIGGGVDLGSKSLTYLSGIGIPEKILQKLQPYLGRTKNDAADKILKEPLELSKEEAAFLTKKVVDDTVESVKDRYEKERSENTRKFESLPRGIRTAIVDLWYHFGQPVSKPKERTDYPNFWKHVTNNDWDSAVKELGKFYAKNADPPPGDVKRRKDEAYIMKATLTYECTDEECTSKSARLPPLSDKHSPEAKKGNPIQSDSGEKKKMETKELKTEPKKEKNEPTKEKMEPKIETKEEL